jgi:TonB-linked SusC/RagA family outer membrane protein
MNMSNQTKLKLNYWLCKLCIITFCLFFTSLSTQVKGAEEKGKVTAADRAEQSEAVSNSDNGSSEGVSSTKVSLQETKISGKVIAANTGESLPGVNIILKGTEIGTVTDMDGNFEISVPSEGGVLVFSFVGFLSEEVDIAGRSVIDVSLIEDITALEEVVVIGYGSMERTNVTGAISSVKAEDINKAPVPNVIEALRGQVSGVKISKGTGSPGGGVTFLIRGKNSIGDDEDDIEENEPLIVIDGVPTTGGNIAEINTDDIASIDILKDAASASIYGASGANGVILITTKTGTVGKPRITLSAATGITDLTHKPELFNGYEFVRFRQDAVEGQKGGGDTAVAEVIQDPVEWENWVNRKFIDWHDLLLKQGETKDLSISIDGGTEKFSYYMNGAMYYEDGIALESDYTRYSFRVNADYDPFKWLSVGAKTQISRSDADETGTSIYQGDPDFTDYTGNSPLGRIYDTLGELVPTVNGDQFQYNPLYRHRESDVDRTNTRFYINPYIQFNIIDGLTLKVNAFAEQRNEKFRNFYSYKYAQSPANMRVQFEENTTYLLDNILNYKKILYDKHLVDATLVYGFQTYDAYTLNTTGESPATELLSYYALSGVASGSSTVEFTPDKWGKVYFVGRLGYGYDQRYHITLTMRRDGSSKFGANNKWGNFPSVSVAWNAHNESFLQNNPILSLLKYRVSYGVMGNDRIPNFGFISLTSNVTYSFGGIVYNGLTTGTFPNESLRWEKSNQFNTGIDFGFVRNRITGSVDYYNTATTDLLLPENIPSTTGFITVLSNIGETKNWGIDANLGVKIINGPFSWSVNMNWAKDKNEIVKLSSADVDAEGNPISDEDNGWFIGEDIDVIYDYDFIGIYNGTMDPNDPNYDWTIDTIAANRHPSIRRYGAGDPIIRDIDGNDTIDSDDRTFLGSPTPDWYGGIRNSFSYKGFELTVLFEAVQGVVKMNNFLSSLQGRDNAVKVNYWTPRNHSQEYPQPHRTAEIPFKDAVRMQDASFIALRNISLEYHLPQSILVKTPLSYVTFYIRGNNLKYWTDYTAAYTPEVDAGAFPTVKTWLFGTKITF